MLRIYLEFERVAVSFGRVDGPVRGSCLESKLDYRARSSCGYHPNG